MRHRAQRVFVIGRLPIDDAEPPQFLGHDADKPVATADDFPSGSDALVKFDRSDFMQQFREEFQHDDTPLFWLTLFLPSQNPDSPVLFL